MEEISKSKKYANWCVWIGLIVSVLNIIMFFTINYAQIVSELLSGGGLTIPFSGVISGNGFTSVVIDAFEIEEGAQDIYDSSKMEKVLSFFFWCGIALTLIGSFKGLKGVNAPLYERLAQPKGAIFLCLGELCCFFSGIGLYAIVEIAKKIVMTELGVFNMFLGIDIQTDMLKVAIVNGIALLSFLVLIKYYGQAAQEENKIEQENKAQQEDNE